jgi:hypothetical protein
MYKVFEVEGCGFQIFWCPSAPIHYNDRVPYNDKIYPQRQGAYRKCKQLNNRQVTTSEGRRASEEVA